jgi:hypothetical protein
MTFSCPAGQTPQLQHDGNEYDFDEPINVSLSVGDVCQKVEIWIDCWHNNIFSDGSVRTSNSGWWKHIFGPYYGYEIRDGGYYGGGTKNALWVKCHGISRCNPQADWFFARHTFYKPIDRVSIRFIKIGGQSASYTLKVTNEDGDPLLEIETNNPDYNLICVPSPNGSNPENCPPGTLDCGSGTEECCDCSDIFNELTGIRKLISQKK